MILKKPKFWDEKIGLLAVILFPFSVLYFFMIFLKKNLLVLKNLKYQLYVWEIFI